MWRFPNNGLFHYWHTQHVLFHSIHISTHRPVSSVGWCVPKEDAVVNPAWFQLLLLIVNSFALVLANVEAYKARNITIEFSESLYIGWIMGSLLQTTLLGAPIFFLAADSSQANYVGKLIITAISSGSILYVIFIPKLTFFWAANKASRLRKAARNGRSNAQDNSSTGSGHPDGHHHDGQNIGRHGPVDTMSSAATFHGLRIINVDGEEVAPNGGAGGDGDEGEDSVASEDMRNIFMSLREFGNGDFPGARTGRDEFHDDENVVGDGDGDGDDYLGGERLPTRVGKSDSSISHRF